MYNKSRIAILMATYNGECYLNYQIESIMGQSFEDWTLYIRDDGSSDSTVEIVREYCKKDSRIMLVDDEIKHRGAKKSLFGYWKIFILNIICFLIRMIYGYLIK